jgi:hypothetical protein
LNRVIRPPDWSRSWKRLGCILLLGICILLGIRFSLSLWRSYQSPCWDGYCTYATLIRSWLTEPSDRTRSNLINWMHRDVHSNSPIGPAFTAILSIVTGRSVEYSYALMSGLATLGILACGWWWLGRERKHLDWIRFPALLLLLTNPAVVRCFVFLQTDALVSFWIVAIISLGLIRFKNPQFWQLPVGAILLSTGLLVKLSFLPALVFLPTMDVVRRFPERSQLVRTVLVSGFALVIVPLGSFFLFQRVMGTEFMFGQELYWRGYIDREIPFIIEVTGRTLLFLAPLIVVGWKRFRADDYVLGICLMIYLFSLWLGRAPGWDRHYLPLIAPAAVLAAKGLKAVADRLGPSPVCAYVLLVCLLQYSAFAFKLVQ